MTEKKLELNMTKPFEYGDIIKIARAEAQKKERTHAHVEIIDVVCEQAKYTVYYKFV